MKKLKRMLALALASMFIILGSVNVFASVESTNTGKYSSPIPLLVIKISFDADGSGTDARMEDGKIDTRDSSSPRYGEQWCYSDDEWWYEQCFSDNYYSLKNYYKYISNNQFWWTPVEETYTPAKYKGEANNGQYDGVNDGVIHVVLSGVKHPNTTMSDTSDGPELGVAVKAADEYVDFSKYDTNGDGVITYNEMTILFVYGGMEASIGQGNTSQFAFNSHAHVSQAYSNILLDDVKVLNGPYVRIGESISTAQGKYLAYGTIAHELGHVLDAKDLYLSDGAEWWGSPGPTSLMGGGSKGRAGGSTSGYVGTSPSCLDPYYCVDYGFGDLIIAESSQTEYTLYSHETGKYNVLRINTPNPNEYYLIENRSHSEEGYDNNTLNGDVNGILVWHINELAMRNYVRPNNGGEGHDVGITVLTPEGGYSGDVDNVAFTSATESFDSSKYKFHTTGTWYMLLTEEQAADYNIKIEFLTEAGDEMTIRIDGIYDMPAQYKVSEYEYSTTTLGLKAVISNYYGNEIESCTISLSVNEDMSDAITKTAELIEDDTYGVLFDGLTADTKYYYKVEMVGSNNSNTVTGSTYTAAKEVVQTYYTVHVYKGLKENESSYKVKVDFGEKFTYTFPMNKSGYAFCGWYLDEELTQKYDMNFTQNEAKDFNLYAKWVPEGEVATLKLVDVTATNKIFSVYPGETFVTPEFSAREGYEFEGWFADAEYTTPFDFTAPVTQTGTVTVYAKWKNLNPETTANPIQTDPVTTEPEQTTDSVTGPVDNNGNMTTIIIIAVVAVVVIGVAAGIAVVMSKKKKNDKDM